MQKQKSCLSNRNGTNSQIMWPLVSMVVLFSDRTDEAYFYEKNYQKTLADAKEWYFSKSKRIMLGVRLKRHSMMPCNR